MSRTSAAGACSSTTVTREAERAHAQLAAALLDEAREDGAWSGELAPSALATAVAVAALRLVDPGRHAGAVADGLRWLASHVNDDGGWGDTPACPSNLSTTTLAVAALRLAASGAPSTADVRAADWIRLRVGSDEPPALAAAVAASYGDDRTFSAPILAVAALAGLLGPGRDGWRLVPQLPFEMAVVPQRLLAGLRVPVVSYALPALIAIGLVRHRHAPSRGLGWLRDALTPAALLRLERLQPSDGGFLEAAPLTAFVALSLAASGLAHSVTVRRCTTFLRESQRPDGSWPIDSDLATWLTTSAVEALAASEAPLCEGSRRDVLEWLLQQQHRQRHPFTGAAPGGFSWTDRPGGVPDADDTAGALLALHRLAPWGDERVRRAAESAVGWLLGLQNADGGVPTFCRGWGRLPFDRSSPDVTAHALAAVGAWRPALRGATASRADRFERRALGYLQRAQQPDGTWRPLWFGNPWQEGGANAVYGTARVVLGLTALGRVDAAARTALTRACSWLAGAANEDGGWGRDAEGGSTVEETALALAALAGRTQSTCVVRGARWLARRVLAGELSPAPIGLYFESLWYSERLYPIVFALEGLGRFLAVAARPACADETGRAGTLRPGTERVA